ncbi:hypothetical protein [Streptomyces sp. URMC 123]|uniref:hypothetical protein n=1 Tax=Streptomyces sp. URMC 123 TaxID=3423403 RepID=UPI003F1CD972
MTQDEVVGRYEGLGGGELVLEQPSESGTAHFTVRGWPVWAPSAPMRPEITERVDGEGYWDLYLPRHGEGAGVLLRFDSPAGIQQKEKPWSLDVGGKRGRFTLFDNEGGPPSTCGSFVLERSG